ncbi:MAG: CPBP family intramembrane metalloprotease [Candidatus Lokiarchaeota archaeon]|nr:CPBP family intramembrane metalloprotease [Candidatus Lokiarchaeota archaeon]
MDILDFFLGEFSYIFLAILLILILILLAKFIGTYPTPFPHSENPATEKKEVIILCFLMLIYLSFFIYLLSPYFISMFGDSYIIGVIFGTFINFLIPFIYVVYKNKWTSRDLGLNSKVRSWSVGIISISSYLLLGFYSFFRSEPIELYWYSLLLLLYSNAFLEEFLFRGIVQSKLERSVGQKRAIIYQGVLFMLIHIPANLIRFTIDGNLVRFFWSFGFQLLHGVIYGLVFLKTRSLWPAVICHYLTNWAGATILLFLS